VRASFGQMTQQEAANLIGVSKRQLRSLFLENVGVGFQEYFMRVKVDRAKELNLDM
jgi:transcriptional regulator GlxA family with amidase domain